MSAYRVSFSRRAEKQLDKLDARQRSHLLLWISKNLEGCENPRLVAGGKKLESTRNGWRYRVGSYRVLVSIFDDELIVEVVQIGHHQGVYTNLPDI